MKLGIKLPLFFFVIAFTSSLFYISPVSSVVTRLYMDPPIVYVAQGESFLVNITVANVEFLYAWQVNMSFNPDVLAYVNVTEGDFLKRQPNGTMFAGLRLNATEGWIIFGWTTQGTYRGESGGGVLATVKFEVLDIGESALTFEKPENKIGGTYLQGQVVEGEIPVWRDISFTAEVGLFTNTLTPPTADFTYPLIIGINQSITFDASASYAASSLEITEYFWDFGDGTNVTKTTSTVNHTYTTGGTFTVSLTVFDNATASPSVQSLFNATDERAQLGLMPRVWYELYGTKEVTLGIAFDHDVAVTNVVVSKDRVTAGETVSINVTVLNKGTYSEDFAVTVYYGPNELGTKQVGGLTSGEERTLIFSWDTTGVEEGDYRIKAVASTVADEGYTLDNEKIDGTITVEAASSEPFSLVIIGGAIGVGVVFVVILLIYMRRRRLPST